MTEVEAHCRLMSLRDGRKKMSKSDPSDYSRIMLDDTADTIRKKIKKAKTDGLGDITLSPDLQSERPEVGGCSWRFSETLIMLYVIGV